MMYDCGCDDKDDSIERRLDAAEAKDLDHDREIVVIKEDVDNNRTYAEALISTRASRGAFSDIEVGASASTVIIAMEREDGGVVLRSMPVVSSDNAGVAPPTLFSEVAVLRSEVDGMKGIIVWYPNTQNTLTTGMTSTQVASSFAVAYPGVVPSDGTLYQNADATVGYRYSQLLDSWVEIFDGVSIAQFAAGVLGMIKGGTTEGQIFAEVDGTGSVVGWDDLIADVGELMVDKEDVTNKRQTFQPVPSHTAYPSEKLVKDGLDGKANLTGNNTFTSGNNYRDYNFPVGHVTARTDHNAQYGWLDGNNNSIGYLQYQRFPNSDIVRVVVAKLMDNGTINRDTVLQAVRDHGSEGQSYSTSATRTNPGSNDIAVWSQVNARVPNSAKGIANGVATLDTGGKVPSGQLPARAISDVTGLQSALDGKEGVISEHYKSVYHDAIGDHIFTRGTIQYFRTSPKAGIIVIDCLVGENTDTLFSFTSVNELSTALGLNFIITPGVYGYWSPAWDTLGERATTVHTTSYGDIILARYHNDQGAAGGLPLQDFSNRRVTITYPIREVIT